MKQQFWITMGLVILAICTNASAEEWRSELRTKMSADKDVRSELSSRCAVIADWVGSRYVELTWNGTVALAVDNNSITDVSTEVINDGSSVLVSFSAFDGLGTLGPSGTMGIQGWLYFDDVGSLRVDLLAGLAGAIYEVGTGGVLAVKGGVKCRCDDHITPGCDQFRCINAAACPGLSATKCGYGTATLTEFESAFEAITAGP